MKLVKKQVTENRISEQEYRKISNALSYSNIKLYDTDREAFYRECILQEPRKEKQTSAKLMGSLIHCLMAGEEGQFDSKFHLQQSLPLSETTHMYELVESLYARTLQSMNSEGIQQDSFETIFSDAVQRTQCNAAGEQIRFKKKSQEQILQLFQEQGEMIYKEKLDCIGKQLVNVYQIEQAERNITKLKTHPFSRDYANLEITDTIEVYNELPVLFNIDGVPCKSMPDRLAVDHEKKVIETIDWKSSHDNEDPTGQYLKYGYYIQAALYQYAIQQWAIQHDLKGYEVPPILFIYCDTNGWADPIRYRLKQEDVERAWRGFRFRGYRYSGVTELMDSIAWSNDNGIWSTTKEISENNGEIKCNIAYGSK